jgi:hypothetical protein
MNQQEQQQHLAAIAATIGGTIEEAKKLSDAMSAFFGPAQSEQQKQEGKK